MHSGAPEMMVVGIGASAGGLTALKSFFGDIPAESGLCFVVIVHLLPDHESHLASILQPHVKMPVLQVNETVRLEANHVYVIPPNANLDAIDTHLRLSKLEARRSERAQVDHFFRTLASAHAASAIGIILSGTGSDGALGIKAIKEHGGLTLVQDPSDAEYEGMPQSAIATGIVDVIAPLDRMTAVVLRYAETRPRLELADAEEEQLSTRALLNELYLQLQTRTGRDFTRYKHSTLLRRIGRRMQLHRLQELSAYVELLRRQPDEARALADDLLITVTTFFRDPAVFDKLETDVMPQLFIGRSQDDDVRLWSVGCATGEEAYSLAILLLEEAERHDDPPHLQVFASDLHEASLDRARHGFYPGDIEADVNAHRLKRFFAREDGGYRVRSEVRETVVFAPHNILSDPPFSRIDLISCRNLLIYLQRDAQEEVDELFHYALRPGGYLVVGTSEAVVQSDLFQLVDKKTAIHVKRDVPTPEPRLPVFPLWRGLDARRVDEKPPPLRPDSYGDLHRSLLERYGPATLLIGPEDRVKNLSGDAGRYLVHPSGEVTASVFKLVRPELRLELHSAVFEARRRKAETRTRSMRMQINGETCSVLACVRPGRGGVAEESDYLLVIFEETGADDAAVIPEPVAEPADGNNLETANELALTRQRLQAVIEEYETGQEEMKASNEELLSANEELRSTLEELETSKEELHSMNEELQTVNQENRHKVEELSQLSGDLQNLLTATDIATLFLDRDLRILRFTPKLESFFNIRTSDHGRPISDLTHNLNGFEDLATDAARVLESLVPIEKEVDDESGRSYLARLLPYRSLQDRIEGVVLTLVETTALKRAEEALDASEERVAYELAAMVELHDLVTRLLRCPDLDSALTEILRAAISITHADKGCVQLVEAGGTLRIAVHEGFGREYLEALASVGGNDTSASWRAFEARRRVVIKDVEAEPSYAPYRKVAAASGYRGVQSTPLVSRNGEMFGILSTHYAKPFEPSARDLRILDLYARQASEYIERTRSIEAMNETTRQLQQEDERKSFFLATLGHELRNPLAALDNAVRILEEGAADPSELHALMASQTAQLKRLVNDLLEVSRVTRGEISLQKGRTDLVHVIQAAARAIGNEDRQLVLPDQETLVVEGDESRLVQVISNLLTNAVKYSSSGSRIEISLQQEDDMAVVTVSDAGRGIEADALQLIFDPFVQTVPGEGGLGIGLALVRRLVELHGGTVEAASDGEGRGSTFTVRIPIGKPAEQAGRERPAIRAADPLLESTRILIVDDSRDHANSLSILLQMHGAKVQAAYSGKDGIEAARRWVPEVALIDIGLPDMTGYEVAEHISKLWADSCPLLIAVTGYGDPTTETRAREAGFTERLVKPIEHQSLYELIRRHIENSV